MRSVHQAIIRVSVFQEKCIFSFHILSYRTFIFTQLWEKKMGNMINLFPIYFNIVSKRRFLIRSFQGNPTHKIFWQVIKLRFPPVNASKAVSCQVWIITYLLSPCIFFYLSSLFTCSIVEMRRRDEFGRGGGLEMGKRKSIPH